MSNYISINGKNMVFSGSSIVVNGNQVFVDGKAVDTGDSKVVNIVVEGDVREISGEFSEIRVKGVTESVSSRNGSIIVEGDVGKNVKTTNGSVNVMGSVAGDVDTVNGNIRHK